MKGCRLKLYLLSSVLLFSFAVQAQNLHYIYIQAEDQKPFYIKINGQTFSSSSSGYIIIPRLTQGSYKSYIGFPKTELGELVVNFIINEVDAGYLLRNDVDQGLYMVNLLTMKFVPTERQWPVSKNTIKSKEEFARVLSEVVNDSSINEIDLSVKPLETLTKAEVNKTVGNAVVVQSPVAEANATNIKVDSQAAISKLSQTNAVEGITIAYKDDIDTIDIFIPANKAEAKILKAEKTELLLVAKKAEAVKDAKFIDMELQNPNQQQDSGVAKKNDFIINQKKSVAAINLNDGKTDKKQVNVACKNTATQTDFLSLRKKMAAEKTEAGMRSVAGKQFSNTCYTTEQVKNLGGLFTKEEERYKFYVSAYPNVSDAENFAELENQLADNYYIRRFKAMLNQ